MPDSFRLKIIRTIRGHFSAPEGTGEIIDSNAVRCVITCVCQCRSDPVQRLMITELIDNPRHEMSVQLCRDVFIFYLLSNGP